MQRAKIAISINSSWNFVNFRAGLVRALVEQGFEVIAIAPHDAYSAQLAGLGCRHIPVALDRHGMSPFADGRLLLQYVSILRHERPAAYLGFTIKPNIYGSLAAHALGVPTICNVAGLGTTFLGGGAINGLVKRMYRAALKRARVVFFQNPEDRDLFIDQGLVASGITRLLPGSGIDLARFRPPPAPVDARPGPVFLMMARLLKAKGVAEYAMAASRLRADCPQAEFRLLGIVEDGQGSIDPRELAQWVREGALRQLARTDDVRPEIAQADCIVLPSYYPEGTPRSLLEGAAMGKPIITTDVPGCRTVVADGENGYLCKPADVESLLAAVRRFSQLSEAERRQMGRASRERAERLFDERLVVAAYVEALDSVLHQTRR